FGPHERVTCAVGDLTEASAEVEEERRAAHIVAQVERGDARFGPALLPKVPASPIDDVVPLEVKGGWMAVLVAIVGGAIEDRKMGLDQHAIGAGAISNAEVPL